MENEEIFEEYTEDIVESTEAAASAPETGLDVPAELEENQSVVAQDTTMEILSDMMADYLEEKGYILEMEKIEEREAAPDALAAAPVQEETVYPFQFTEDGYLQVQICNPFESIFDKELDNYTVSESLLLGILLLVMAVVAKNFLFSANFFRKGW